MCSQPSPPGRSTAMSPLRSLLTAACLSGVVVTVLVGAGRAWYLDRYRTMGLVAAGLLAPMLILAVLHAVAVQSPALVLRAVANLPVATLGTAAAVAVVDALVVAVDHMSGFLAAGLG